VQDDPFDRRQVNHPYALRWCRRVILRRLTG
jgi:hypothetical protein